MSKLIDNERIKLIATGLNNLGIATIVAGTIGPFIARSYGAAGVNIIVLPSVLAVIYLAVGLSLMGFAQIVLGGLVE